MRLNQLKIETLFNPTSNWNHIQTKSDTPQKEIKKTTLDPKQITSMKRNKLYDTLFHQEQTLFSTKSKQQIQNPTGKEFLIWSTWIIWFMRLNISDLRPAQNKPNLTHKLIFRRPNRRDRLHINIVVSSMMKLLDIESNTEEEEEQRTKMELTLTDTKTKRWRKRRTEKRNQFFCRPTNSIFLWRWLRDLSYKMSVNKKMA